MTGTELNEKLAEPQENESVKKRQELAARRRMRRDTRIKKNDDLLRIINYGGYAPHRGYIDWGFDGTTLLHSGKYIKYPKNSNCQRWMKRETNRRIRNCKEVPKKDNCSSSSANFAETCQAGNHHASATEKRDRHLRHQNLTVL